MRKKRNSNIEWVLLGCAALFFGAGWSSFDIYMTQVFAIAGSEGLAPPYSLLSMSLVGELFVVVNIEMYRR